MNNTSNLNLFSPLNTTEFQFPNRIAMAALTRCRADYTTNVPNELHVKYYSERAKNCAFVLTECTAISKEGNCFAGACGIHSEEQVEGWKKVTEAVHNEGGRIFLQIWHCGRANHPDIYGYPIAPSPIALQGEAHTLKGKQPNVVPREMTKEDIQRVIADFRAGAENAKRAGFDGLELHGANGYLVDEFLRDSSNKRTDEYGGSVENRSRFCLEVIDELISVFGKDRVGIKLSPLGRYQDMMDTDPKSLYIHLLGELSKKGILFAEISHSDALIMESQLDDQIKNWGERPAATFRKYFNGLLMDNLKLDLNGANEVIQNGVADLVSFGRLFIANPDLVERFKNNWPLNSPDFSTVYSPGEKGYTDYPHYQSS